MQPLELLARELENLALQDTRQVVEQSRQGRDSNAKASFFFFLSVFLCQGGSFTSLTCGVLPSRSQLHYRLQHCAPMAVPLAIVSAAADPGLAATRSGL